MVDISHSEANTQDLEVEMNYLDIFWTAVIPTETGLLN
jgi:hypothetical protein